MAIQRVASLAETVFYFHRYYIVVGNVLASDRERTEGKNAAAAGQPVRLERGPVSQFPPILHNNIWLPAYGCGNFVFLL